MSSDNKDYAKVVRLKENMPFIYKGVVTWYEKGDEFVVVQEETLPDLQLYYRVVFRKYPKYVFDGHTRASVFEVVE